MTDPRIPTTEGRLPEDIVVSSWMELCERVYDHSWQQDIRHFRANYVFRGLSDINYPLNTSLQRLGGPFSQLEYHLLRNFKKYGMSDGRESMHSDWWWWAVAQHHGLPTRLLDWTYSPFVAMHFATAAMDQYDRDGVIWAVEFVQMHQLLPARLRTVLEEAGAKVFTMEMLERVVSNIGDLAALPRVAGETDRPYCLFYEPPSLDARIVNQYALFSVLSDVTLPLDDWLRQHPRLWRRIVIPKELKWEVRDKLDQANITERILLPGLDGLAMWLARHYSPSNLPPR